MDSTNYEQAHGTVFFDPNRREFIQVREIYFSMARHYDGFLHTGHFTASFSDAKNDIPEQIVTQADLKHMINVEEVGLKNIKHVYYENGSWWAEEKPRCPTCGRAY